MFIVGRVKNPSREDERFESLELAIQAAVRASLEGECADYEAWAVWDDAIEELKLVVDGGLVWDRARFGTEFP